MNVLLSGPPEAGKGTQAKRLEASSGLTHVASGDLLHRAIREQSAPGRDAPRPRPLHDDPVDGG